MLATALYDKPAFRNVIVNGMVMAKDGKKMSKRLRNYTPPDKLMETYGADALRLYLINSGLVRGEEQRFSDRGVRDMTRRALLPWYNAFTFLKTYAEIDHWSPEKSDHLGDNVLDRWILSRLQTLKANIAREMDAYRLYNVVPALFEFIEELTQLVHSAQPWPFLGRGHYRGQDCRLHDAAHGAKGVEPGDGAVRAVPRRTPLSRAGRARRRAAPSQIPFICATTRTRETGFVEPELEAAVARLQQVILLGRQKREEEKIGLRTPLRHLAVINRDAGLLEEIAKLETYIKTELNVLNVTLRDRRTTLYHAGREAELPGAGQAAWAADAGVSATHRETVRR